MKKTIAVLMCIIISLSFTACSLFASSTGKKAVEEGNLALAAGKYREALGYFELARNEGIKSAELNELINIINKYIEAQASYDKEDYENAKTAIDSVILKGASQSLIQDVNKLKTDIQDSINLNTKIDSDITSARNLLTSGDYAAAELNITEIESTSGLSASHKKELALLKQELEAAKEKEKSISSVESVPEVIYISESDKENAKNAFVGSGSTNADDYYSYMSAYSPSWSNAYKTQWNYFKKHNITSYQVEDISFESVTYDSKAFYVVDKESISETKNGVLTRNTTRWKYTVTNDSGSFKVTAYKKVK